MKKLPVSYSLKYSRWIYIVVLLFVVAICPLVAMRIINIIRMAASSSDYTMAIDIIVILLLLLIAAVVLTCLFIARYTISTTHLTLRLGLFIQKIKLPSIKLATYVRSQTKLVISYNKGDDLKQILVNIDEKQFDEFIEDLIAANKDIIYNIDSDE